MQQLCLEISSQRNRRTRSRQGVAGEALTPVEVHADIPAHLHRYPWSGVETVQARLRAAPDTEAGREIAIYGAGEREPAVDEQVAGAHADDAALQISVEIEPPGHRPLVEPAFEKQGEVVAAAAIFPELLAPLGGDPHRDAGDGLDANARGDFAAAPTNDGAGAHARRNLAREIVGEPGAGLAGAERAAAGERGRAGDAGLLTAQKRPGG